VYVGVDSILGENINTAKNNAESVFYAGKEVYQEVNAEETKKIHVSSPDHRTKLL
jgi:hypothetical protein